ncbi:16S rRNA (guanine(527)-N(7))-methyltransferase RsmG [Cribrihabitans neustonicus]|uniref:16S rRNA (guanine(527)-N(7))-methyltransferase RsmG n=1 Tax=Cribrihabitans neustonicus TaxID=1429085 RepID=UPI003B5CDA8B
MLEQLDVSRETLARLEKFEQVICKWNPKINLVSRHSLKDLWTRHIVDSIQVFRCAGSAPAGKWVDIGSGGGFPGLIIAILSAEEAPDLEVVLIESDQRKAAFLRTAARECGVKVEVRSERIEKAPPQEADIMSARALADLALLFEFTERHLKPGGVALFPKGASWKKEVDNAQGRWRFDAEPVSSITENEAVILKIRGVARV